MTVWPDLFNCAAADKPAIERLLRAHNIDRNNDITALRRNSMACVAFPTCALAMAESERYLPGLIDKIDTMLREFALEQQSISIRMSGCPNGCSRPYLAEIAFVGKAPGKYNVYLGASANGDRLNTLYRENIGEQQILETLRPLLQSYSNERQPSESFGDFVIRSGIVSAMREGRDFQRP